MDWNKGGESPDERLAAIDTRSILTAVDALDALRAGRPVVVPGNKERARDVHLYVPFGPREKKVDIYVRVHPF